MIEESKEAATIETNGKFRKINDVILGEESIKFKRIRACLMNVNASEDKILDDNDTIKD